jgi:hypothetical protein
MAKHLFKKGEPRPANAGRKVGIPNKATADIKALAQSYAPEAVKELARLALNAQSEQARVTAIKEILDRAFGKPHITAEVNAPREVRDLSTAGLLRILAAHGVFGHEAEETERLH